MKKTLFLLGLALIAICFVATSCSNNNNEVNDETLEKTSQLMEKALTSLMAKEDLPDWLAEMVTDLEKNAPPMSVYKVYRCKWNSKTVYYIYWNFSSCVMCETYFADGIRIEWNETVNSDDFQTNSSDWKCIYVIEVP